MSEQEEGGEIVKEWVSFAESGDTKGLGKAILNADVFDLPQLEACTRILLKANASRSSTDATPFYKAGLALIEALVQKEAGEELAKLAFFSWKALDKSPLSIRCLDSAVAVGNLDDLYDIGHRMHSKRESKTIECAANLILKLAQAGYRDAYFITGQFFRDGHGLPQDLKEAAKWFGKAAYILSGRAESDLSVVPDAFLELAKLQGNEPKKAFLRDFYLHQAEAIRKAKKALAVLIPGQELESLIEGDESDNVEFKASANPGLGILQEIAAFLNTKGGYLFIGVDTKRQPVGLTDSYKQLNVANRDLFERHLTEKMHSNLKGLFALDVTFSYPVIHNQEICLIRVRPSKEPVYLKEDSAECFYVRTGNSRRKLPSSQIVTYCKQRFFA